MKRVPSGSISTWSTIASRLWPAIGRPRSAEIVAPASGVGALLAGGQGVLLATPAHVGGFLAGLLLVKPLLLLKWRGA